MSSGVPVVPGAALVSCVQDGFACGVVPPAHGVPAIDSASGVHGALAGAVPGAQGVPATDGGAA
ncbi:hypothetical protein [Amycolatopsis ultiminotia]|uniref:hypothetical protein n=1 Tax=Amycolatopsis ultiminotia TaxID=543629 RepID=UPI0031F02118